MPTFLTTHDHYLLAAFALFGTLAAAIVLLWLAHATRFAPMIRRYRGLSPPFVNIIGVLFALTLAFLANDTWNAHDRAVTAIYHEAGSLHSIHALAQALPPALRERAQAAIGAYIDAAKAEWPLLGHRQSLPVTDQAIARLQEILARPDMAANLAPAVHAEMLHQAMAVRDWREQRISLSQTHVNPLKWLGMAFLGLLTMISIAMVYVDQPKAEFLAIALFAAAAAPTAAIVLIQGNPFQQPGAVTMEPITALGG